VAAGSGLVRVLGALIAVCGLGVAVLALLAVGIGAGHYQPRHAALVGQLLVAIAVALGIVALGAQYAVRPQGRPRAALACLLLIGALLSTALSGVSVPPTSALLLLIGLSLGGAAWVVGSPGHA
jgi:hypothetical protein